MDNNNIALIALNPGRVGWFDPITNIHLTLSHPEAYVTKGMNVKNIKKAVNSKILRVVWGNLSGQISAVTTSLNSTQNDNNVQSASVVESSTSNDTTIIEDTLTTNTMSIEQNEISSENQTEEKKSKKTKKGSK